MKTFIAPYNLGSASASELSRELGALRITGDKKLPLCQVINWGNSELTLKGRVVRVFNKPQAVKLATNKIATFNALNGANVPCLEWTTSPSIAKEWLGDNYVYCRTDVTGSQGSGIIIASEDSLEFPMAPLYTKGFNKTHEYRVHVAFGRVIDFSKKKKRLDVETNSLIKNSNNGWVFCREGVVLPEQVRVQSIRAISALGLDFGALDVLYKERDDECRIAEVNTAPGIEASTLQAYIKTFKGVLYG